MVADRQDENPGRLHELAIDAEDCRLVSVVLSIRENTYSYRGYVPLEVVGSTVRGDCQTDPVQRRRPAPPESYRCKGGRLCMDSEKLVRRFRFKKKEGELKPG